MPKELNHDLRSAIIRAHLDIADSLHQIITQIGYSYCLGDKRPANIERYIMLTKEVNSALDELLKDWDEEKE
ncbi:MAG: hypothetical protein PHW65_06755 [Dehalococcoidales bacterium]|nr:hypothetical protein [Dehalococcoidales bacterium]